MLASLFEAMSESGRIHVVPATPHLEFSFSKVMYPSSIHSQKLGWLVMLAKTDFLRNCSVWSCLRTALQSCACCSDEVIFDYFAV